MVDLSSALSSGSLSLLVWTAGALGFLHTIIGPDHYLPFVMMARAQTWSRSKTALVTLLCGMGHVISSLVIGAILAYSGMAITEWAGSKWAFWHEFRGSLSAWLLIGIGGMFMVWGIVQALRGKVHTHAHRHSDNSVHAHEHDHHRTHMHVHRHKAASMTPWILFTIFVFGPCESLIPLMLSSWSIGGTTAVAAVSAAFGVTTILTIMGTVFILSMGVERIPLGPMNRWSTALAGFSLVACGAAIQWLGL